MITRMNKLTLLVYHKEYTDFLQRLRNVGVVHVVEHECDAADNPELEKQLALSARYKQVIKRMEMCGVTKVSPAGDIASAPAVLNRFDTLAAEIEQQRTADRKSVV